jgi:ubiquinone/menaquinone biosynthesis C-methylase UbiE
VDLGYIERRKKNLLTRYKIRYRTAKVLEMIKKYSNSEAPRILDAGCCDGTMLRDISKSISASELVGIDNMAEFLKCGDIGESPVRLENMDMEKGLGFEDKSFDVVIASSVIEHLSDADSFIKEVVRVLDSSGIFILLSVVPIYEKLMCALKVKTTDHYRNFRKNEISKIVETAGFKKTLHLETLFTKGYNLTVAQK